MPTLADTIRNVIKSWDEPLASFRYWISRGLSSAREYYELFAHHFDMLHGIQHRYLRAGILPSMPLVTRFDINFSRICAETAARAFAEALREADLHDDSCVMEALGDVAAAGHHTLTLRAIFPAIEAVARERAYEPDVTGQITSLPSLRYVASDLFVTATPKSIMALWEHTDLFALTILEAFDYAYVNEGRNAHDKAPLDRLFKKIPNRHIVCHGNNGDHDEISVVNALTMLYMAVKFSTLLSAIDRKAPHTLDNGRQILKEARMARRKINNLTASFFRLGTRRAVPSETPGTSMRP